eukprot:1160623-Pelagomonas_calceolata.AAC.6
MLSSLAPPDVQGCQPLSSTTQQQSSTGTVEPGSGQLPESALSEINALKSEIAGASRSELQACFFLTLFWQGGESAHDTQGSLSLKWQILSPRNRVCCQMQCVWTLLCVFMEALVLESACIEALLGHLKKVLPSVQKGRGIDNTHTEVRCLEAYLFSCSDIVSTKHMNAFPLLGVGHRSNCAAVHNRTTAASKSFKEGSLHPLAILKSAVLSESIGYQHLGYKTGLSCCTGAGAAATMVADQCQELEIPIHTSSSPSAQSSNGYGHVSSLHGRSIPCLVLCLGCHLQDATSTGISNAAAWSSTLRAGDKPSTKPEKWGLDRGGTPVTVTPVGRGWVARIYSVSVGLSGLHKFMTRQLV